MLFSAVALKFVPLSVTMLPDVALKGEKDVIVCCAERENEMKRAKAKVMTFMLGIFME
jgi:hypothetical protein